MTVKELIEKLQKLPNQNWDIQGKVYHMEGPTYLIEWIEDDPYNKVYVIN